MKSERVQEVCDTIRTLQNGEEYDRELIQAYKRQLPAITPHACRFEGDKRSNTGATASGLAMLDVDHVENARERFGGLDAAKLRAEGIYMVAITPSGKGLRVIGERKEKESIPAAQQRIAQAVGVTEWDTCTKDLARLSYLMPWSYVLYFDGSGLEWPDDHVFATAATPALLPTEPGLASGEKPAVADTKAAAPAVQAAAKEYPLEYEGLPYRDIAAEMIQLHGGDPSIGERNTMYFSLAIDMRYLCDFDAEFMLRVLPDFGLSAEERRHVCESALKRPRRNSRPALVERAISEVRAMQKSTEEGSVDMERYRADELELPRLPRLLQVVCRHLPASYRPAMVIASLPVLGALATGVRFRYLDGAKHSFSFLSCITAPAATGKSFIRTPVDLLLTPINRQDAIEREKEQKYKEDLRKARNKKEQPDDPHACPRNNGINISIAALLKLMSYSGGKHLIAVGEEIDTLVKSERAGVWSQKSDIYRLAFDNAEYGQQYLSENSFSAHVPVYYNLLVTGTPGGMYRFFKDVENGLVTRVAFATLPDMFATQIPRFEAYTEEERNYIVSEAERLTAADGEKSCSRVEDALGKWQEEKRRLAEVTDSRAVDILRRRSGVIGYRAGMLCWLLNGEKGGKQAADFGVWVAEYVFRQQMQLFGSQIEAVSNEQQRNADKRGSVRNLLELLPQAFEASDLMVLRRKNGQSSDCHSVLHRWLKAGLIRKDGRKRYVKLVNG